MEASTGKIILNVGGVRYETYSSTLRAFPGTKLCSLTDAQAATAFDYNPSTQEFFFDRSARLFGQVLNYYRTRHLHCPAGICRAVFEEELAFWGIADTPLSPCCWTKLSQADGEQEDYSAQQDNPQGGLLGQAGRRSSSRWWARRQPQMWALLEEPYSSRWAMVTAQHAEGPNTGTSKHQPAQDILLPEVKDKCPTPTSYKQKPAGEQQQQQQHC